jgi:spore germination protein KA
MPKTIGHAVSIVGALVIGDAAVTAGLIGAPMLIVVAMTAICSLVSSEVYQPISGLRIVFIIIGGFAGLYGIMIGAAALIVSLSSMTDYGVPYLAPFTPYNKSMWRDSLFRQGMEKLGKRVFDINALKMRGKND